MRCWLVQQQPEMGSARKLQDELEPQLKDSEAKLDRLADMGSRRFVSPPLVWFALLTVFALADIALAVAGVVQGAGGGNWFG